MKTVTITIEGSTGTGKSTLTEIINSVISGIGVECVIVDDEPLGEVSQEQAARLIEALRNTSQVIITTKRTPMSRLN